LIKARDGNGVASLDGNLVQDSPVYHSPPPLYLPIQGPAAVEAGITHNLLSHYVDMSHQDASGTYGTVLSRDEINDFTL